MLPRPSRPALRYALRILHSGLGAIRWGYEDVNDHDRFRGDPIASMFCGTSSPLAGKSTINRMELGEPETDPYKKIVADVICLGAGCVRPIRTPRRGPQRSLSG